MQNYNWVRFDWAMKRLLRNKANFSVLEGFLSELLRHEIKIIKLLESESNQDYADDKYRRKNNWLLNYLRQECPLMKSLH